MEPLMTITYFTQLSLRQEKCREYFIEQLCMHGFHILLHYSEACIRDTTYMFVTIPAINTSSDMYSGGRRFCSIHHGVETVSTTDRENFALDIKPLSK